MRTRHLFLAAAALADLSLLVLFFLVRTDQPLVSPWELVSPLVFIVFGCATAALWLAADETPDGWFLAGFTLHLFTAVSVSALVYTIGFGFDPLLHQAAELVWSTSGIPPDAQLLYSGQYALVALLATITRLHVFTIDRWLVPLLATLTPIIVFAGLRSAWKMPDRAAAQSIFALILVPFAALTFTIPYHLGVIVFLWIVSWLPSPSWRGQLVLFAAALAILVTHPLIGIPTLLIVAGGMCMRLLPGWSRLWFWAVVVTGVATLALPAGFFWFYRSQLAEVIDWSGLMQWERWLGLFRDPYPFAGWHWEILYLFRQTIPLLLTLATGILAGRMFPEQRRPLLLLGCVGSGLFFSTYIVTTLFRFPDIIWFEQQEFPLRLLQLLPLASYPAIGLALAAAHRMLKKNWQRAGLCLAITILSTIAWFFSYPQLNAKAYTTGPSASSQDEAIVQTIEAHASGTPHIVLAAPITSALAVRMLGFRMVPGGMLWYPLPTGGTLFPFFTHLSTTYDPARAGEAAALADVKRVYVIRSGATPTDFFPVDNLNPLFSRLRIALYDILLDIYDIPQ